MTTSYNLKNVLNSFKPKSDFCMRSYFIALMYVLCDKYCNLTKHKYEIRIEKILYRIVRRPCSIRKDKLSGIVKCLIHKI